MNNAVSATECVTDDGEVWRPIPGFGGYEVSSAGRVRSVKHSTSSFVGRLLTPWIEQNGYLRVSLCVGGKPVKMWIHRLVALAFQGFQPSSDHEVAHWDGDKTNNSAINLRWATRSENSGDTVRLGRQPAGEMHGRAVLSNADVAAIRSSYTGRYGEQTAIARQFGVSQPTISVIVRNIKRV